MSSRHTNLLNDLSQCLSSDAYWGAYLDELLNRRSVSPSIHVAVMIEPYLKYILDGQKTVESRFSIHRRAPYQRVNEGDIIFLKKSGGPIVGVCQADYTWFYQLDAASWDDIKTNFAKSLCANDQSFWDDRKRASYATLIRVINVREVEPISFVKRDRRGWVVVEDKGPEQPLLGL